MADHDVTWFAVDRDGHVAVFVANECGAVPTDVDLADDPDELLEVLRAHSGDTEEPDGDLDDGDGPEGALPSGVYVYWHEGGWLAWPYENEDPPESPLSSTRLSRAHAARLVRFDGRFADHRQLQPAEHWPCTAPVACWLATDQRTVRCIPGQEDAFAAEAATVEAEFPGEYVFEAATPAAPPWWQFWRR